MKKLKLFWIYPLVLIVFITTLITACTEDDEPEIETGPETGILSDIDGNTYNTVIIGSQTWMTENLKTTTYRDGTAIPNIIDRVQWYEATTPGYCWYNNSITYKDSYGALYNWYAVNTGKLAPTGWRVPTLEDWTQLANYLGGDSLAGGKLKEAGFAHWESPNTGASNSSGFTALPAGYRNSYAETADFLDVGYRAWWWSATESESFPEDAWLSNIMYNYSYLYTNDGAKHPGFSVRCIKD